MEKGKLFIRCAVRAVIIGLKQIPIVGGTIDWIEYCIDIAHELEIEQDKHSPDDRVIQLEEAADINPHEAREIASEVVTELMRNNEIPTRFREQPTELKTAVENIMSAFPAQIRKHTQATIRKALSRGTQLSSVLPVDNTLFSQRERTEFYF